jgi:glycosyltransferase involved in cell wall biosynthesis
MSAPTVSICIPAWQAEPFIDRTLTCARRQTYRNVRILVSVDWSSDQTLAICRRHAADDPRVAVFSHSRRLGWAANCNFLLDQVESDFFFLYFHDDIILPEYTERLLSRLAAHPKAASSHCDMGHFGGSEAVSVGRDYLGPTAQRLATFLVAQRGSPLRSLTRSHYRNLLRMPTDAAGGFWANIPYLMRLFAAGEAVHLPEILYHRWDKRPGGLTDGWTRFTIEQIHAGYQANARAGMEIIQRFVCCPTERAFLVFCLYLRIMQGVRTSEQRLGIEAVLPAGQIHAAFAQIAPPTELWHFGQEVADALACRLAELRNLEHRPERQQGA